MDRDEFLVWIESNHDPQEVVELLLRYGVCDEQDVFRCLREYIPDLKSEMDFEELYD